MTFTTIRYDVKNGVATITLNRPESRNALNRAMCEDLVAAAAAATKESAGGNALARQAARQYSR